MKNNILSNVMIFVAGAAVGAAVTWKLLDEKYKKMVKEETDTLREIYGKAEAPDKYYESEEKEETKESEKSEEDNEEEQRSMYKQMIARSGYTNYNKTKNEEKEVEDVEKPYLITPDEFGELDGYRTITLWCYSDGTVVDDHDNPIEKYENIIGKDFINHFGDYENDADSVFVRNDRLRTDYEILRDVGVYEGLNR